MISQNLEEGTVRPIVLSACISLVLILSGRTAVQPKQDHLLADSAQALSGCDDSPTGRRPANANCAVLTREPPSRVQFTLARGRRSFTFSPANSAWRLRTARCAREPAKAG